MCFNKDFILDINNKLADWLVEELLRFSDVMPVDGIVTGDEDC